MCLRSLSQSKGAVYAARWRYGHKCKFSCTPAPRASRSARVCDKIAVQSPSQVQFGLRPQSQSKCAVVAARWWYSHRDKLSVPPLPEPVEGAYVKQDGGTATGASSVWHPLPEPVEVRVCAARLRYSHRCKLSVPRPLSQSKCAYVRRDGGTVTVSS